MSFSLSNKRHEPTRITRRRLLQVGGIGALSLGLPGMVAAAVNEQAGTWRRCCREVVHLYLAVRRAQSPRHVGPEARGAGGNSRPLPAHRHDGPWHAHLASCIRAWPRLTQHFSLIRSMTHVGNISNHFDAMHHCLSGQADAPADSPYIGSVLAKVRPSQRSVASYVWLIKCVGDPVFCAPNIGTGGHLGIQPQPAVRRLGNQSSGHAWFQSSRRAASRGAARADAGAPPVAGRAESCR